MSPITDLQVRMRELGRIRMGVQVPVKGKPGKTRPERLDTFRLTSPSLPLIQKAADEYGGLVEPWGDEWQVIVAQTSIDIVIPPDQSVSQWFELYSAGGCQRRCDGVTNVITGTPCACPKDTEERLELASKGEACKVTTRLSVMLPQIPDLGVWTLTTHSYNAALELAGVADLLRRASEAGFLIPASLRIDQRERKVPGQPTKHFPVPVIELRETRLADLPVLQQPGMPMLAAPARPALPSTTLPERSDFRAPDPDSSDGGRPAQPGSDRSTVSETPPAAVPAPADALERPRTDESGEVPPVGSDVDATAGRPETGDEAGGLTAAAFRTWLKERDIGAKYVEGVFKMLWPNREPGELTDQERERLQKAVERARAGERI